ncbi:MAG: hypothetical protein IPM64_12855 [Phycisphaerales bacterium]|nr:hypothetical protein [Phycisphaerales bacterium]
MSQSASDPSSMMTVRGFFDFLESGEHIGDGGVAALRGDPFAGGRDGGEFGELAVNVERDDSLVGFDSWLRWIRMHEGLLVRVVPYGVRLNAPQGAPLHTSSWRRPLRRHALRL